LAAPVEVARPAKLPKIPLRGHSDESARLQRLEFLRRATGAALYSLQSTSLFPERLTNNIENMIGGVEVPVGIAGPLLFQGEKARGVVYARSRLRRERSSRRPREARRRCRYPAGSSRVFSDSG